MFPLVHVFASQSFLPHLLRFDFSKLVRQIVSRSLSHREGTSAMKFVSIWLHVRYPLVHIFTSQSFLFCLLAFDFSKLARQIVSRLPSPIVKTFLPRNSSQFGYVFVILSSTSLHPNLSCSVFSRLTSPSSLDKLFRDISLQSWRHFCHEIHLSLVTCSLFPHPHLCTPIFPVLSSRVWLLQARWWFHVRSRAASPQIFLLNDFPRPVSKVTPRIVIVTLDCSVWRKPL